ncbi:hypothetical protein RSAG8_07432, partial [Rhizoctonia solani AG-8 WAC10335]
MQTPFCNPADQFDKTKRISRIRETVTFVEERGAKIDRWRTLIVLSNTPFDLFAMIMIITGTPAPLLQFLSLAWANNDVSRLQEILLYEGARPLGFPSLVHGPERPQFCHVEAIGLPNYFLFGRRSTPVSNLTTFTFACSVTESVPSHQEFSDLLSASPQLESLSVNMQNAGPELLHHELELPDIASLKVRLPLLRSFSLDTAHRHQWCLNLLQIIDAPGVEYFSINSGFKFRSSFSNPEKLYEYLARGRINGVVQPSASIKDDSPGTGPIFPLLKHLNIQPMMCNADGVLPVFRIFPMVTHVTLGGRGFSGLSSHPDLLPSASHLTYIDDGSLFLRLAEFPRRWAMQRTGLTLVVCTSRPGKICEELGLVHDCDHLESERHYHLPGLADRLIIRQIGQKLVDWEGGGREVPRPEQSDEDEDIDLEIDMEEPAATQDGLSFTEQETNFMEDGQEES